MNYSPEHITLIIGITAGVLTAVSMMPQVIRTLQTKKAEHVSPVMLIVLIAGVSLWAVYGILKKDIPIICTNSFSVLINVYMLYLRWRFRKNK